MYRNLRYPGDARYAKELPLVGWEAWSENYGRQDARYLHMKPPRVKSSKVAKRATRNATRYSASGRPN